MMNLILSFLFLCLFAFVVFLLNKYYIGYKELKNSCNIVTKAKVIDCSEVSQIVNGTVKKRYHYTIEYVVDNEVVQYTEKISRSKPTEIGSIIELRYNVNNPSEPLMKMSVRLIMYIIGAEVGMLIMSIIFVKCLIDVIS